MLAIIIIQWLVTEKRSLIESDCVQFIDTVIVMLTKLLALHYAGTEIQHLHWGPLKTFSRSLHKQHTRIPDADPPHVAKMANSHVVFFFLLDFLTTSYISCGIKNK